MVIADAVHFHITFINPRSHDCPVNNPLGSHNLPPDLIRVLDPNIPTFRTGWRGAHNNDITAQIDNGRIDPMFSEDIANSVGNIALGNPTQF